MQIPHRSHPLDAGRSIFVDDIWHRFLEELSIYRLPSYTVAGLPAVAFAGQLSFATDGRKDGEGAGAGTGVLVYYDGTAWRASDTSSTVAA